MSSMNLGFSFLGGLLKCGLSLRTAIFNSLINGLGTEKRVGEAAMLFDEMGCKPNVVSCTTLVKGFYNTDSIAWVLELYQKMAMLRDSHKPNIIKFNTIIGG